MSSEKRIHKFITGVKLEFDVDAFEQDGAYIIRSDFGKPFMAFLLNIEKNALTFDIVELWNEHQIVSGSIKITANVANSGNYKFRLMTDEEVQSYDFMKDYINHRKGKRKNA